MTQVLEARTAGATDTRPSLDYRSFATVDDAPGWRVTALDQLATWLRSKKRLDLDLGIDGTHQVLDRVVTVRHHEASHVSAFRLVMEEDNDGGHWTTRVMVVEDARGTGWVSVDVVSAARQYVGTPWAARYFLDALSLTDAGYPLRSVPRVMGVAAIPELVTALTDPRRRAPVYVTGTDATLGIPFDTWVERVTTWTSDVAGLAHVVVLDPVATAAFEENVGREWAAPAWAIRTYQPGLDLDDGSPWRHRLLGTQRLVDHSDGATRRLLGRTARALTASQRPPSQLVTWRRKFDRLETSVLTDAIDELSVEAFTTSPTPAASAASDLDLVDPPSHQTDARATPIPQADPALMVARELGRVQSVLGLDDLEDATLTALAARMRKDTMLLADTRARLQAQDARIEQLDEDRNRLRDELETSALETLVAQDEIASLKDRNVWLGKELARHNDHATAFMPLPEGTSTDYPTSYEGLLERVEELRSHGLHVTADERRACELDAVDTNGQTVRTAWDALLTLVDYKRACDEGSFAGDMRSYLANTPPGFRNVPPKKYASGETQATMDQYGDERVFAVPDLISTSGRATMTQHFKLGKIGMVSPRLYYYDDHDGPSGLIVVGYIGRHLRNTQTN
ncbi:hypothetical protein [Cellulosimicrobium sp. E-16]|uniref:hypothetical protein n=1 Tax=Cellulosimicrobium sp. E-16 TaxID=3404049 RepID=UPI003CF29411